MNVMSSCKTVRIDMMFMFIYPTDEIFCYTNIYCYIC